MVYPGQQVGGIEADMMAANELNAHASLQSSPKDVCPQIQAFLGGFETKTGEQWLAFRDNGKYSAADYAKITSEKMAKGIAGGKQRLWNPFELDQTIKRRRYCSADDRLLEAVKFLDLGDGAGWELLQAMLNRDYRGRPIAEAVVNHLFLSGTFL